MLLYAVALYGSLSTNANPVLSILLAPVAYLVAMYLYYGIARLAFSRRTWSLLIAAAVAIALSLAVVQSDRTWLLLIGWSMLLVTGYQAGYLTRRGYRTRTVYITAVASLTVLGSAMYLPLWLEMFRSSPEHIQTLVEEVRRQMSVIGESEERTRQMAEVFRKLAAVVFRLAPAAMVLSVVAQFTIGYLLFARWIDRFSLSKPQLEPFRYWKMPYGFIPIVALAALTRLVGSEPVQIVSDNVLLMLGVFYMVTGLALVEYGVRKAQFSRFMKVLLYIFLALLPLVLPPVGLIIGGTIALLGFADSFADWRRVRLREFG